MGEERLEGFKDYISSYVDRADAALDDLAREYDKLLEQRNEAAEAAGTPLRDDDGPDKPAQNDDDDDIDTGFDRS